MNPLSPHAGMPSALQPLPPFPGQRVHHIHRKIAYVIEPCSECDLAIHLRRIDVTRSGHFNRHRHLTKSEIEIGIWLSAHDGFGERRDVDGDSPFDHQATEKLREVQMHIAHLMARVVGK